MSRPQHDSRAYLNPVYPKSFPDPFVLKFEGEYFGYCTGLAEDGNVFGMIRSRDLVNWVELGGAMEPLADSPPLYWAPEVVYDSGKFYLYYSVGNETLMELRVAVSERPDGGFVDSGHRLTTQDFAIDAHVFINDDGSKYLFYATDFLEHEYIGTGTVVERMLDWFTLEGIPLPVTRARYDWQVYDPNRKEKGGVRWHTVEGPAVLKRKGIYYEMFSGGNWQNTTYGVSFAVSDKIENPDEWLQFSDGENVMPILRTLPEVVGPGHNSIVRGPNNRELFCIYHRWTDAGRVMAIDRMDFAGDRLFLVGATHTPQPAPYSPSFDSATAFSNAATEGEWTFENQTALSGSGGPCDIKFNFIPQSFLCELTLQCAGPLQDGGSIRINLTTGTGSVDITFLPISNVLRIEMPEDSTGLTSICKLPEEFDWRAPHLLRIDADFRRLKIKLDEVAVTDTFLASPVTSFAITSVNQSVAVRAFQLTEGFEELFEDPNAIDENGWEVASDHACRIEGGEFVLESAGDFLARRHWPAPAFEFAANLRFLDADGADAEFGLLLEDASLELLRLSVNRARLSLEINGDPFQKLPANVVLTKYHQLRIIKIHDRVLCYFDDALLHDFSFPSSSTHCSVFCKGAGLGIEMIRITTI